MLELHGGLLSSWDQKLGYHYSSKMMLSTLIRWNFHGVVVWSRSGLPELWGVSKEISASARLQHVGKYRRRVSRRVRYTKKRASRGQAGNALNDYPRVRRETRTNVSDCFHSPIFLLFQGLAGLTSAKLERRRSFQLRYQSLRGSRSAPL
jgi:hypothetical protein